MKALVTGSAGFLGRHFVHELRTRGWDVDGIDIEPMAYPGNLDWDEGQGLIRTTQGDVMDAFRMTLQHGTKLYDLVVHAAAMAPNRLGIDRIPTSHIHNRMLDAAMFDWAIRTGQARVLYLSSCVVLDRAPDPYGETKLAGEKMAQLARRAGTPVTVVRPFSGYGSDQSTDFPFPAFVRRVLAWEDPFTIWGDGDQVRDWIHVDDVVRGALAVVDSDTEDPIQLCSGVGTSMFDLTRLMHRMAGQDPEGVSYSFLGDMPTGPTRRVGDPRGMLQLYTPTVSLEQGIKRALSEHSQVWGHPHWCAHQYPHPRRGCSVIHRRDCDCKD
jgi:nucleoside-diphosphate-sugar epimerase